MATNISPRCCRRLAPPARRLISRHSSPTSTRPAGSPIPVVVSGAADEEPFLTADRRRLVRHPLQHRVVEGAGCDIALVFHGIGALGPGCVIYCCRKTNLDHDLVWYSDRRPG